MIENKENDLLLTMLENPNFTFQEMQVAGLNTNNTSLNTREAYKEKQIIQDAFKTAAGDFNEDEYNKWYDIAVQGYNIMANTSYEQAVLSSLEHDKDNIYVAPETKKKDLGFTYTKVSNPFRQNESMVTLGRRQESLKTFDEIAQGEKVLVNPREVYNADGSANWDKAIWHDAPEDKFFEDFWDTRVIAQYDEAGTHVDPITGQIVEHKQGDLRLNENGTFYYENLDGRDVYGRRVLNKLNVITKEDTKLNHYDFFDSDDLKQKSLVGNVTKNLFLVGTMFIPYVGPWVAAASVLTQSVGLMGTLGKMFTDSENETFSAMEGWSKSLSRQNLKTQYAQEHTWCWENFVNLIGDVAGQLREQRFLFDYAPALFKGTTGVSKKSQEAAKLKWTKELNDANSKTISELIEQGSSKVGKVMELGGVNSAKAAQMLESYMKDYNKIGSILSKAYMTAVTVGDTYGEAKLAGATDEEAMWLTLGYAAAELAILNSPLGEWILPELRADSYKFTAIRKALLKSTDEMVKLNKESLKRLADESTKQYSHRLFKIGKDIAKDVYGNGSKTLGAALANAAGEGLEEVSEEFLADFSKQCFNWYKQATGDTTHRMTAWDNMLDRYSMSLLGGALGGGLAHLGTDYKMFEQYGKLDSRQAVQELVYMARNNELEKFINSVNKSTIAPKELSATKITKEGFYEPGTEDDNQDLYAKKAVITTAQMIQDIINSEGAAIDDDSFLTIQTRGDYKLAALANTVTAGKFLQEFNTLTSDIAIQTKTLKGIYDSKTDENKQLTEDEEKQVLKINEIIKEKRDKMNDLLSGKRSSEFLSTALFEASTALSQMFIPNNFQMYAEYVSKKKFTDLSDKEKTDLAEQYNNYIQSGMKDDVFTAAQIFHTLLQGTTSAIQEMTTFYESLEQDPELTKLVDKIVSLRDISMQGISPEEWLAWQQVEANEELQGVTEIIASRVAPEDYLRLMQEKAELEGNLDVPYEQRIERINEIKGILQEWTAQDIEGAISETVQRFINVGYINSAVRNRILPVLNSVYLNLQAQANEADPWVQGEFDVRTMRIQQLIDSLRALPHTPIEEFVNKFSLTSTGQELHLTELLETVDKTIGDFADNVAAFTLTQEVAAQVDNALELLKMFTAVLYASRTDNVDSNNAFGYSATLNQINKGEEGWTPLLEVDSQTADVILQDLNLYYSRLVFAKNLFNINSGQTMSLQNRVGIHAQQLLYKKLNKLIINIDDDWIGKKELYESLQALTLLNSDNTHLNREETIQLEKEKLAMEDAVYDFFQKNGTDPKKLSKLLMGLNLYTSGETLLTDESEDIDDNAFIWWLAGRAAVKATDFYYMYKNVITDEIAPIPTQELATYLNYASIVNGNVFTAFMHAQNLAVEQDWKSKSPQKRKQVLESMGNPLKFASEEYVPFIHNFGASASYSNIILTEGIPGSGKTTGVLKSTIAILAKYNKEVLANVAVLHIDETRAGTLAEDCGLSTHKDYSYQQFLEMIIANYTPLKQDKDGTYQITEYSLSEDGRIQGNYKLKQTSIVPSLIIIDEVTKINRYELEAVNNFAKIHGIQVLTCGDYDQSGVTGTHKVDKIEQFKKDDYYVRTNRRDFAGVSPKLGISMRTNNKQADQNNKTMQAFLQKPEGDLRLHYYQDDSGIYGDKIHSIKYEGKPERFIENGIDLVLRDIDLMLSELGDEKLTYVYNDAESELYKELSKDKYKDRIDFKVGSTAQGLEGKYYVVDLNPDQEGIDYWKELYTAITRRSKGSLIVTQATINNQDGTQVTLKDVADSSTLEKGISTDAIKAYSQQRKELLNEVITEGSSIKVIKRNSDKPSEIVTEISEKPVLEESAIEETPRNNHYSEIPVTGVDVVSEVEYKEQIDASSESEEVKNTLDETSNKVEIVTYSHATFELGVAVDVDPNTGVKKIITSPYSDKRIDSINGLSKIPKYQGYTVDQYIDLIGQLRSIIFNTADKTQLCKKLEQLLGYSNIYCTFGIKSKANSTEDDFWDRHPNYTRYYKAEGEKVWFNHSKDEKSEKIPLHTLSIIISSQGTGHLVELPLLVLTNPYTLMQVESASGNKIYQTLLTAWDEAPTTQSTEGGRYYERVKYIRDTFKNDPQYQDVVDLCEIFLHTKNDFFDIPDTQWTVAKNLTNLGIQFTMSKGSHQALDGLSYEADWEPLKTYQKNPSIKMTPILISRSSRVDGIDEPIVKAGHPFVLVSGDVNMTDDEIARYYIKQYSDPKLPKKVKLIYILPPKASIESYVDNLFDIINNKGIGAKDIGDITTSYKLLKVLLQDSTFVDAAKEKLEVEHVIKAVQEIQNLEKSGATTKEIQEALYTTRNWSEFGGQNKSVTLSGLFDGFIKNFIYLNTGSIVGESQINKSQENLDLVIDTLTKNGIDGIYYSTRIPILETAIRIGDNFIKAKQGSDYTFDVRPGDSNECQIHGKFDTYVFKAHLSEILHNVANRIRSGSKTSSRFYEGSGIRSNVDVELQQFQSLIDLTNGLIDKSVLSDYYSTNGMQGIYEYAANIITNSDIPKLAFVVDGKLVITQDSDLFKSVTISNLTTRTNSTTFNISPDYEVTYQVNNGVPSIEVNFVGETQVDNNRLNVTDENMQMYKDALAHSLGLVGNKFKNLLTAQEIIDNFASLNLKDSAKLKVISKLQELLNYSQDNEMKDVIQDILRQLEQKPVEQKKDNCKPIPINVAIWQSVL